MQINKLIEALEKVNKPETNEVYSLAHSAINRTLGSLSAMKRLAPTPEEIIQEIIYQFGQIK